MELSCSEKILSEDYADFIVSGQQEDELRQRLNTDCIQRADVDNTVLYTKIDHLGPLLNLNLPYSVWPKCFGLMDLEPVQESGVLQIQNQATLSLRGQGVLIAVIDTGIDIYNPLFQYADGTSRIVRIWDQTVQEGEEKHPEGFLYGTEYRQEELDEAIRRRSGIKNGNGMKNGNGELDRNLDLQEEEENGENKESNGSNNTEDYVKTVDENGHGTFLAGIAAGNYDREKNFTGVAPDCELVIVKLKGAKQYLRDFYLIKEGAVAYQENDILLAVKYVTDVARELQRPIVVLVGMGTNQGGHSNRGRLSTFLDTIGRLSGVGVCVPAGNEGIARHHFFGTVDENNMPENVEIEVGENERGFIVELWGSAPNLFSIELQSPTGDFVPRIPARLGENRTIQFLLENTTVDVGYQIAEQESGAQLVFLRFHRPSAGIWKIGVYASGIAPMEFHMWLPIQNFTSEHLFFIRSNPDTTVTIPGSDTVPMSMTAYNHRNESIFAEASRGFTRTGEIKPDLAAPGVDIEGPGLNARMVRRSGTSIAAAHGAGIMALLLEWAVIRGNDRSLNSVAMKNYLIRGAKRDMNIRYPSVQWGYGMIDIYRTFLVLRGE